MSSEDDEFDFSTLLDDEGQEQAPEEKKPAPIPPVYIPKTESKRKPKPKTEVVIQMLPVLKSEIDASIFEPLDLVIIQTIMNGQLKQGRSVVHWSKFNWFTMYLSRLAYLCQSPEALVELHKLGLLEKTRHAGQWRMISKNSK